MYVLHRRAELAVFGLCITMKTRALILCLFFATTGFAQNPPVKVIVVPPPLPIKWEEIVIPAGQKLARLSTGDKSAKWLLIDSVGCEMVIQDDGKTAVLTAIPGKSYRVIATCDGSDSYCMNVNFGGDKPVDPVNPNPPPVNPVDPFKAKIKTLYAADTNANKGQVLNDLIALFDLSQSLADDKTITTVLQLATRVRAASEKLSPGVLSEVRKAITAETAATFPTDATLTDALRVKAKALFAKISIALSECK